MNLRRRLLWALGLGWGATPSIFAQHVPAEELLQPYIGRNAVEKGRVSLEIARLADNGFNVPLKVSVSSPMTVQVLISTRVRLGGSQTVYALAQTSDSRWWIDTAEVEVTESACLDQT